MPLVWGDFRVRTGCTEILHRHCATESVARPPTYMTQTPSSSQGPADRSVRIRRSGSYPSGKAATESTASAVFAIASRDEADTVAVGLMDSNSEDTAARKTALAERVHTALRNADWPELERSARSYLELDRTEWWFHGALARALRELRRPAEAEDTLQSAMLLLPDGLWLYVDYARLAEHARDWDNALIQIGRAHV